jgi:cytochrome c2
VSPRPRGWTAAVALAALTLVGAADETPEPEPAEPPPPPDIEAILAEHHVDWDPADRAAAIDAGADALERNECTRCHVIDEVEPAGRSDHCVNCHVWLEGLEPGQRHYEMLSSRYGEAIVQRYQRNIFHYREVPDLSGVARRLDPRWIDTFLQEPWDLRPALEETMPRLNLSAADRRAIVRYFAATAEVADPYESRVETNARPSAEHIAEGKALFLERGCVTCHSYGNVDTGKSAEDLTGGAAAARMAPNLRFAGDRMHRDVLVAWIEEPALLKEDTAMPDMGLTHAEAQRVADFLIGGDPELDETPPVVRPNAPPPVDRPVGWAEVKEKVLGRICVHCHMNAHERDLGPGHEGGFGWPGSELAMRTYETLVHGAVDRETGERYSVLQPREEGQLPPLIEVMLDRRVEELRDRVEPFEDYERPPHPDTRPGMPMGLPSIPDDEIAIVRGWIAAGCPGPTEVTGMPGIDDGFLVPDGPIAKNEGCELRPPSADRPEWSTQPPPEWARESGDSAMSGMRAASMDTESGISGMATERGMASMRRRAGGSGGGGSGGMTTSTVR